MSLSPDFEVSPCPESDDFPPSCCPQPPEKIINIKIIHNCQDYLLHNYDIEFVLWYAGLPTQLEIADYQIAKYKNSYSNRVS